MGVNVAPALRCILRPCWGRQETASVSSSQSCSTGSSVFVCLDGTRQGWRRVSHNGLVCSFLLQQELSQRAAERTAEEVGRWTRSVTLSFQPLFIKLSTWLPVLEVWNTPGSLQCCAPIYYTFHILYSAADYFSEDFTVELMWNWVFFPLALI